MFLDLDKKAVNAFSFVRQKATDAKAAVATAAVTVMTAAPVMAQEADINAKITAAGTQIVGYATAVVGIMVGFWAVKRAGQKMGWW